MKDSEYPVTPFAPFDSRPKIEVAKPTRAPADPFEGIPRLRSPSNLGEVADRIDRELRDTDTEDLTPAARPFEIRVEQRLKKLEELAEKHSRELESIRSSSRDAAQHALDTHDLVKAMAERQRAFELERKWVPRLAWLFTTAIALLALYRTYYR